MLPRCAIQVSISLLVLALWACGTNQAGLRHEALMQDKADATEAIETLRDRYREGHMSKQEWDEALESYRSLAKAQVAYVDALAQGHEVAHAAQQQQAALRHFLRIASNHGVEVREIP